MNIKNREKKLLLTIGIDPSNLGYIFLTDALDVCFEDRTYIHNITKKLYPYIADKNQTTSSRVERVIRNSIESACYHNPKSFETLEFPLSYDTGKLTNSQFIAACVEHLKIEDDNKIMVIP